MSWLEDLLLVLAFEGHSIVDVLLLDMDSVDGLELAHWVCVLFDHLRLLLLLLARLHEVWHALDIFWANVSDLQGWEVLPVFGSTLCLVLSMLSWCQGGSMSMNIHFHLGHVQLFEGGHYREFYLRHVKLSLHFLILIVLQRIKVSFQLLFEFVLSYFCISIFELCC